MHAQTNVGLLCCVGSGCNVAVGITRDYFYTLLASKLASRE